MMKKRERSVRLIALALTVFLLCGIFTGCESLRKRVPETEETTFGIDVARYQGTIDWQQVADSGVQFAMIRVGYRAQADGQIREDPNARYNLQEASRAGIALGAYFFSTAISEEEAKEEAAWTADILSGYPITYPVVYDCENYNDPDSRQYPLSRTQRTDLAFVFLETIEKQGYHGMFYGSKNDLQYDNAWETSRIEERYKIWIAQYPENPFPETPRSSYEGLHHMWQYSTEGAIPGISQPVDLNIAYFGYEGTNERKARKEPEPVEANAEAMFDFQEVQEVVTAKDETRLRDIPSQGEDANVIAMLKNGEFVQRIAVSSQGWSKLLYKGQVCYAVSSYLMVPGETAASAPADDSRIRTQFEPVNEKVTAKIEVNLRSLPSVEDPDCVVVALLKNGEVVTRTGINRDVQWSRVEYNGQTLYCISSYLMEAE